MTRKEAFAAIRKLPLEGKHSQRQLAIEFAQHVEHLKTVNSRSAFQWARCHDNRCEWASMAMIAASNAIYFSGGDAQAEDEWQLELVKRYVDAASPRCGNTGYIITGGAPDQVTELCSGCPDCDPNGEHTEER